jgi:hypothetical protein
VAYHALLVLAAHSRQGTWEAGIFSNDAACDVRGDYRLALEEDERVKAEALAVIDQGRDLASWEGSDLYGYRRAVLRGLRQQLTSPSPPSKQVRPPRRPDPEAVRHRLPYQEGSLFQVPLRDGGSARGLVSRLDPSSGVIVAYFFGPAAQRPWIEEPAQVALKLPARPEHIARCPDVSLRRRRWPALGRLDAAAWASWPQPPYDQPPTMASFVGTDYQTPRCPQEAELGDPRRFSSSRHAVRHTGLDVAVYSSDGKRTPGRLARQGPPVLRWALFEATKCAARPSSPRPCLLPPGQGSAGRQPRHPGGGSLWDTPSIITSPGHGPADQDTAGRPRTPAIAPPPAAACSGVVTMH